MSNQTGAADARIEVGYDAAVYERFRGGESNPEAVVRVSADGRELTRGRDGLRRYCGRLLDAAESVLAGDAATVECYGGGGRYRLVPAGETLRIVPDAAVRTGTDGETAIEGAGAESADGGGDRDAGVAVDREGFLTEILRTAETFCDVAVGANPALAADVAPVRERVGAARVAAAGFGEWGLPVRLLDAVPETAYGGTVYAQTAVVAAGDARFGAFDGDTLADDTARDAPAAARIWLSDVETVDRGDGVGRHVEPNPDALVWHDHAFAGEVVSVGPVPASARTPADRAPERYALLHVGAGTVAFDPDEVAAGDGNGANGGSVAVGDFLRLRASRVHLSDIAVTDAPSLTDRSDASLRDSLSDPSRRAAAAAELARRGAEDAADALVDCLRTDPPVADRRALVRALDVLDDRAAVPGLVDRLADPDPDVRRAAAGALATIGDPESIDPLLAAVRSESDAATRRAVARAARDVDPTNALDYFAGLVRTDTDPEVRETVVRVLSGTRSVHAEALVVEALDDPDTAVACEAIDAVRWLTDERPVGGLLRRLMDDDPTVRAAAAGAFVELGARTPDYHGEGAFGPETRTRVVRSLLERLDDESAAVRATVIEALGSQAHPESVAPLCDAYDRDTECRPSVVDALGRIGDPRAIPTVVAALDDDRPGVRRRACRACARLGTAAGVSRLCRLAREDPRPAVRVEAVEALGRVGDDRDEVFDALEAILDVREAGVDARGAERDRSSAFGGAENADLRWEAVTALGRLDHPRSRFLLRWVAEEDPDDSVRDRARSRLE
ncbi:HEAT repeat domain-containing protein [Halogeometricum luteum]|uniref:HEAT repeat domain-containing protein n=1 Tax=Halogeometricum luteum TaxID=2950537 RepID=A0ABU2G5N9_9EURY|nr:HEAT repeat domain-containing protein [Halogeometricum sp. S3BR5-2]MDS0296114.1 HEAT repeat domain-containing protein [Halogeometricum sp. S3BR5-2]